MYRYRTKLRAALLLATTTITVGTAAVSPATAGPGAGPAVQQISFADATHGHATKPFSMLGVTWADPRAAVDGTIQVRTRATNTGRWTAWQSLEADGSAAGDRRGASDPVWVGASAGVEARIVGARRPFPAGLRVDLINPDAAPATGTTADRAAPERAGDARPAPSARRATGVVPLPTRPVPRMVTRAGWRANEAIVRAAPTYTGPAQVFFVHHTASGNGYSCADSAAIVRGIQAYQVRTKGWDDIGYNFLVDKCGRIFEGRRGGVNRMVLGAHTMGFNSNASAIAVIGTYGQVGVSSTVRTAIATVAAYKLGAAGNAPAGKVVLTSGGGPRYPLGSRAALWRISGHRDAGRTDCPGDSLYRQLPAIREIAGAAPYGLRYLRMPGASKYGTTLYTKGLIRPLWNMITPSALINRFEAYVDGELAVATPGSHRTTALRLRPGGHVVTIRALHLSGKATMVGAKVISDVVAPRFTGGPALALRTGSLDGSVPVQLQWTATDENGIAAVALTGPSMLDLGTVHSRNGTLAPGRPATFALRAADRAGNTVDGAVTRTPVVASEAAADRTGTWRTLTNPGYLGGVALGATAAGSSATWQFTGSSAALAVSRAAQSGRLRVFVDGDDLGVLDLGSPQTVYRQAIWSRSWPTSGSHTVRVEVEGTPGRPGVVLDGLVYLK
ncbi:hypothetical protein GCM10010172_42550 [Paractinoplanes ferrugineus]|uniref:Peptidoglycan recognition protein family domain-containing protein n=1 Tax=Paractinoplanes ferrugineus TaxID=113564 RepID=A0A919MF41_9ACTN|nr:N-acetylmuramoyl-L-alanine amidase [Actinoplanes ferrugineus]GIE13413.1 hypothetical protein Afe05nite_52530 [Actinoplanes ferrugineus]